jgi:hypothetical protein
MHNVNIIIIFIIKFIIIILKFYLPTSWIFSKTNTNANVRKLI